MPMRYGFFQFTAVFVGLAMICPTLAFGQELQPPVTEYRLSPGDKVLLTVPERVDLNREVIVDERGAISLPLIGDVLILGLTPAQAEGRILQALRDLYPSISKVELSVTPGGSQFIYVMGQVAEPGKYTFARMPSVWEAIREAGGPLGTASLDDVRIVTSRERGAQSEVVDVMAALETGTVDRLPVLRGGDTVMVPERAIPYTGSLGVNVYGSVVAPGMYKLEGRGDLVTAILLAGGHKPDASLGKVRILRLTENGSYATQKIDFKMYLEEGHPEANPVLRPGDTVNVPAQNALWYQFKTNIGIMLNIVTTAMAITALSINLN